MRIEEALKLSDIAVTPTGDCVYKPVESNWYYRGGKTYLLHEISSITGNNINWQPAYVLPQFQIGEQVSFLQACLSGQCFKNKNGVIHRCTNIATEDMKFWEDGSWVQHQQDIFPLGGVTIVADPSQEPKKPKRTRQEIVAEMNQLIEELSET